MTEASTLNKQLCVFGFLLSIFGGAGVGIFMNVLGVFTGWQISIPIFIMAIPAYWFFKRFIKAVGI